MGRPVHFEIHASDPERSREFYHQVFGWSLDRWGDQDYWVVTTGEEGTPGINGGLLPRRGEPPTTGAPVNGFVITVAVDDLDETVAAAQKLGGELRMPPDLMPGVGRLAYLADPDGNLFGVLQPAMPGG